ncbi:thiolase family protein [Thermodesulfobacteriota bacterium]
MKDVVIVSAVRTAIGEFGGSLRTIGALELAQLVISEAVKRAGGQPEIIDKVIFGNAMCPAEQNIARLAAYGAGLPEEVPAFTINCTCGSSIQAVISSVQAIQCGDAEVVLAGGVESMSNAPFLMNTARWGHRLGNLEAIDLVWAGMQDPSIGPGTGLSAENTAERFHISREDQDAFALLSHQRAAKAIAGGIFKNEIMPVTVTRPKKGPLIFNTDEHPRSDVTLEQLAGLKPVFKEGGTVTAGNACGINDGAAATILTTRDRAKELGLKPLSLIRDYNVCGADPHFIGISLVHTVRDLFKKTGLTISDIDRFEINEAFASQYLYCERELGLDREKVNPYGNGIALGHPVGATGCRLLTTLLYGMQSDDLNLGIYSLCAGGGMGFAVALERI